MAIPTWLSNFDAKIEAISWKKDINSASTKVNELAVELNTLLSKLPVHGPAMTALQTVDTLLSGVTDAIDAATAPSAPAAQ